LTLVDVDEAVVERETEVVVSEKILPSRECAIVFVILISLAFSSPLVTRCVSFPPLI